MLLLGHARRRASLHAFGWLLAPLLAFGLLAMHGLEPSQQHATHSTMGMATVETVESIQTAVLHAATGVPGASSLTHLAWACAWFAAGALLLVTILGPYGRVASLDACRASRLELAVGRGSRAPPSATRLSLVGVLRR